MNAPLTGQQLRNHARTLAAGLKAEGPVSLHAIQLHSTTVLADYAARLRGLVVLALGTAEFRKLVHAHPVAMDLYTSLFNTELAMGVPLESRLSQVPSHAPVVPGPAPDAPPATPPA